MKIDSRPDVDIQLDLPQSEGYVRRQNRTLSDSSNEPSRQRLCSRSMTLKEEEEDITARSPPWTR